MLDMLANKSFVSPYEELIALESLYADEKMTLKKMTDSTVRAGMLPSELLREKEGFFRDLELEASVKAVVDQKVGTFSVVVNGTPGWPGKLSVSERPTPLLYYRGDLSLIESKSVSVVGSRKASAAGLARARRLARELCSYGVTVVTGLARGIDTAAAASAIGCGGNTIGVVGTPVDEVYPKENEELQNLIASRFLLVSQVPFYRYSIEPFDAHRYRFPERNELMAAISDATVIVEASDTSGTLSQARACMNQGRPLFIARSLLEDSSLTWPKRFAGRDGVYVLDGVEQVLDAIGVAHAL